MEATTRNSIRPNDRHRRERSIIETKYVSPRLGHKSHTAARREKSITPSLWGAKITSASETFESTGSSSDTANGSVVAPPASGHLTRRETLLPAGEMPPNRTRMEFWCPTGVRFWVLGSFCQLLLITRRGSRGVLRLAEDGQ